MTQTNPACDAVRDDLALIIDGDARAMATHAAHLADCDACRDLRHDAELVARRVGDAGADYRAGDDLADRVLAALERAAPRPAVAPAPAAAGTSTTAAPRRFGRLAASLVGIGALGAAAAGVVVVARRGDGEPARVAAAASTAAPAAAVTRIARSGVALSAGATGVELRLAGGGWQPLAADATLPAAAEVRTDERTRAWLTLASGDALALDQATTVRLGATPEVVGGRLVVDGAPASRLQLRTAHGAIHSITGRAMLTVAVDQTTLRVVRGAAALGNGVVRAGEEALATASGQLRVVPVPGASAELAWSELDPKAQPPADAPRGLGSLRAYKPGESRDRDWNLALAEHDVQVRIAGPLARTEVTETFRNDTDHELEGVFVFPLPADAKIDDLALDVATAPGGFEHGAFVASARAQKIWNGVIDKAAPKLQRRPAEIVWVPGPWKDPALLNWKQGGRVELRVFPIPAKGSRTIKLAYTQVVAPRGVARQYAYPLAHAVDASTAAEKFTVGVEVRGARPGAVRAGGYALTSAPGTDAGVQALRFAQDAFVPHGDLVVQYQAEDDAEVRAWTFAGNAAKAPDEVLAAKQKVDIDPAVVAAQRALAADARPTAVLALRPTLPQRTEHMPRDYAIVVDASQTMVGERWTRARSLVETMAAQLDARDRVTVLACDDECASAGAPSDASAARAGELGRWLGTQAPGGASDPVGSLRLASAALPPSAGRERWILYVGDGVATTGQRKVADIGDAVDELVDAAGGTLRIGAVGIGSDASADVLAAIARGGGGSAVTWPAGSGVAEVARGAIDSTAGVGLRDVRIELPPGLADAAPTTFGTIRAGEEVLMATRITAPTGTVQGDLILRGSVGGEPFEQRYPLSLAVSTGAGNRFVPPLWASLAIDELDRSGAADATTRAVAMSQAYGVMSRHTSLLVLESQAMFDAFGVERGRAVETWTGEDAIEEVLADGSLAPASDATGKMADDDGAPGLRAAPAKPVDKARADSPKPAPRDPRPDALDEVLGETKEKKAWASGAASAAPAMDRWDGGGRRMVAMRRVWSRVAGVSGPLTVDASIVEAARAALDAAPDSRERHRDLVQALAYAGDVDGALDVAQRWLVRDALDPAALDYVADLRGRRGERDLALRTLAGTVDLAPDAIDRHERMALAYAEAGRLRQACGHRVALAALAPDASRAAAAVRCSRALAQAGDAERVLRALPDAKTRVAAERLATADVPSKPVSGDLVIRGTWSTGADLDLSIVNGLGRRISWHGGRSDLVVDGALSTTGEVLAVKKLKKGSYRIEVVRPVGAPSGVLRGTVEVVALGQRRTLPFELIGDRATVGDVKVRLESSLVRW